MMMKPTTTYPLTPTQDLDRTQGLVNRLRNDAKPGSAMR
jgi:hypothetical protein